VSSSEGEPAVEHEFLAQPEPTLVARKEQSALGDSATKWLMQHHPERRVVAEGASGLVRGEQLVDPFEFLALGGIFPYLFGTLLEHAVLIVINYLPALHHSREQHLLGG
jgi:hypothetical protein